jgi:hypothetical protein
VHAGGICLPIVRQHFAPQLCISKAYDIRKSDNDGNWRAPNSIALRFGGRKRRSSDEIIKC